ncbi:MAG: hypothetical protein GY731_16595 [Gammaproteobacteria bacterium]|nr:hypothetical protein [Gammaproteobacteria bacterium]
MNKSDPKRDTLDALAARLLAACAEFDEQLHENRKSFPDEEFGRLWQCVQEYCAEMKGLDWIHKDVAREISGLREYLELDEFRAPGEVLAVADRMETLLFSDHDPHFGGDEPPEFQNDGWEGDDIFGGYEAQCAGCDGLHRVDDLGLCRECAEKLERDLLRKRDWAYSTTVFGMAEEQREMSRRRVVKQFGEELELIAAPKGGSSNRKSRKRRRPKPKGGN